jgi:hypothetical protein
VAFVAYVMSVVRSIKVGRSDASQKLSVANPVAVIRLQPPPGSLDLRSGYIVVLGFDKHFNIFVDQKTFLVVIKMVKKHGLAKTCSN